jgi:hypothetical protein
VPGPKDDLDGRVDVDMLAAMMDETLGPGAGARNGAPRGGGRVGGSTMSRKENEDLGNGGGPKEYAPSEAGKNALAARIEARLRGAWAGSTLPTRSGDRSVGEIRNLARATGERLAGERLAGKRLAHRLDLDLLAELS